MARSDRGQGGLPAAGRQLLGLLQMLLWALRSRALPGEVLNLRDGDFQARLEHSGLALVEFFAPRCGRCMRLAPEYEEAAIRLQDAAVLAKVDCSVNTETCDNYDITSYPTLKLFNHGVEHGSYEGSPTAAAIVRYMKRQMNSNSQELRTQAELDKFINDSDAGIVGFFADSRSPGRTKFLKAENSLEIYRFAYTTASELLQKYSIEKEGIILFRPLHLKSKFEDSSVRFKGTISVTRIKKYIQKNIFGFCPLMTIENREQLNDRDLMVAFYNVDYDKNSRGTSYWRNRVMMVAKKFLDAGEKLAYAIANRQEFEFELQEFGLSKGDGEIPVVTIKTTEGHKYVMQETFTRDGEALERFLQWYFNGTLKRFFKSQPIPEKKDEPVQVVVADNFDEIVNNKAKDVLINFFAPWCGQCKSLEPKYQELAEILVHDPNVVIAKMDATANDVPPPYDVTGFPTIYFAPMDAKHSPKPYEGDWRVKDLLRYLEKKSTYPLVAVGRSKKKKYEL
ncbi:protein disulfide-isomerase A3-like isoform X2 [Rhinatrema bivittatum]|uniref:protein disulfide-isomerase A3-like isoform X2 n=1 Tax=Rhinatrema bivittatum TaxID=194408 RepID=UPI00112785F0|nr:protein disulfide-isomerase A3-like isoform X2 [Rhinatrema bivittatum]